MANVMQQIMSLPPVEVVKHEAVKSRFVNVYESMWTPATHISGEMAYEQEKSYFNRLLLENQALQKCNNMSIMMAFIDLASKGLSLEQAGQPLAYLIPRGGQCRLMISPYGELVLRERCGQIRYADNPVIVYEGDDFEFGVRDGQKIVNYIYRAGHNTQNIIACFLKIIRPDGSADYSVMFPEDWDRLANYSAKQGKRNALYGNGTTTIDTGFLKAKCIKHAFRTYPKVRLGQATLLESEDDAVYDGLYNLEASAADVTTGEVMEETPIVEEAPAETAIPQSPAGLIVDETEDDDVF